MGSGGHSPQNSAGGINALQIVSVRSVFQGKRVGLACLESQNELNNVS